MVIYQRLSIVYKCLRGCLDLFVNNVLFIYACKESKLLLVYLFVWRCAKAQGMSLQTIVFILDVCTSSITIRFLQQPSVPVWIGDNVDLIPAVTCKYAPIKVNANPGIQVEIGSEQCAKTDKFPHYMGQNFLAKDKKMPHLLGEKLCERIYLLISNQCNQ